MTTRQHGSSRSLKSGRQHPAIFLASQYPAVLSWLKQSGCRALLCLSDRALDLPPISGTHSAMLGGQTVLLLSHGNGMTPLQFSIWTLQLR
jgi:hypothetical protein